MAAGLPDQELIVAAGYLLSAERDRVSLLAEWMTLNETA